MSEKAFVPFRVKEIQPTTRKSIEDVLNEWFTEIANDPHYEYDIRQVLPWGRWSGAALVFYEVRRID